MRIGIDVMGGDHAPDQILQGCLDAIDQFGDDDRMVLIGDGEIIDEYRRERGLARDPRIEVVATTQLITMSDSPVSALRTRPDSSIVRMAELGGRKGGERRCDVVISAGNTGACVAASQMAMRRLPHAHRPGIAVTIPTFHGPVVICDVGANPEPKPPHLHQYGVMASVYARAMHGIDEPRVALLSIGGEEGKGNTLTKETHKLLKADPTVNYIGYGEGREIFDGHADVFVTEGFTGNVVLKLAEGLAGGLFRVIAHEIFEEDPELAMRFEPIVKKIYRKHDYHEYGGAPLLGANGTCMIMHGSSEARTIVAAIRRAFEFHHHDVNHRLVAALSASEKALALALAGPDHGTDSAPTSEALAS